MSTFTSRAEATHPFRIAFHPPPRAVRRVVKGARAGCVNDSLVVAGGGLQKPWTELEIWMRSRHKFSGKGEGHGGQRRRFAGAWREHLSPSSTICVAWILPSDRSQHLSCLLLCSPTFRSCPTSRQSRRKGPRSLWLKLLARDTVERTSRIFWPTQTTFKRSSTPCNA
jgi:hypothetical protein